MTDGTATASPITVVTSASATPGATAAMFPEPPTAIPMKASITPSTVPSRPSSGLTEPKVASHGMKRAAASRSAATSLASTIRSASSCVAPQSAKLPHFEEDQVPGDDREDDQDGEHELRLATGREHELPRRGRNGAAYLQEHAPYLNTTPAGGDPRRNALLPRT